MALMRADAWAVQVGVRFLWLSPHVILAMGFFELYAYASSCLATSLDVYPISFRLAALLDVYPISFYNSALSWPAGAILPQCYVSSYRLHFVAEELARPDFWPLPCTIFPFSFFCIFSQLLMR